jgi:hypothetical protein
MSRLSEAYLALELSLDEARGMVRDVRREEIEEGVVGLDEDHERVRRVTYIGEER